MDQIDRIRDELSDIKNWKENNFDCGEFNFSERLRVVEETLKELFDKISDLEDKIYRQSLS